MRIVHAKEMPFLPEGTIYCEIKDGYSYSLDQKRQSDDDKSGWWNTELLPQALCIQESDGQERLRIRPDLVTWRPIRDESFHVFESADLKILVNTLSRANKNYFDDWVCIFPGKLGLSWKLAHPYGNYDTKAEAEIVANQNCNVVAVPRALYERYKEYERRAVQAERTLQECQSNRLYLSVAHPSFGSARVATSLSDLSFEAKSSDH